MTERDWERMQRAVGRALELPAPERDRYLAESLGDDPELLHEAASLVASGAAARDFLERPLLAALELDDEADLTGTRIDRYRLLSKIGSGGMSDVYEAVRDDGEYQRRVAVKLLHRSAVTAGAIERFRNERQILAALDHRHIATILDGGTGDDGRPYFVMRRVEGVPIDRYCDAESLPLTERLTLFAEVCEAVAHAHRRLVVHCDIKPSNILVDRHGEPQLLDFGIAHLLDDASPAAEGASGSPRALTPGYASPEQRTGQPLTTATDIYSLGALLHKLLLGRAPRDTASHEPPPPLPRPLESVLARATAGDPADRYPSAADLAADVRRFLGFRPVAAMPPSAAYRLACYLRRNWAAAAIGGVLIASALTLIVYQQRQSVVLERERDQARRERATTDEVASFLVDLFEVTEPDHLLGRRLTVEEILDRGGQQAAGQFVTRPEIRAQLLATVGRVNRKVGRYDEAIVQQRQALEILTRSLPADDPAVIASLVEMGDTHLAREEIDAAESHYRQALDRTGRGGSDGAEPARRGRFGLAQVLARRADYDAAERILRELIAEGEAAGSEPVWLAEVWSQLGRTLQVDSDLSGAEQALRRALALQAQDGLEDHPVHAETLLYLSHVVRDSGDLATAAELCREATEHHKRLYGERHPNYAAGLEYQAGIAALRDDLDESERLHRQAIGIYGEAVGRDSPAYASMLNNLAVVLRKRGDLEGAVRETRRALEIYRSVWGEQHPHTYAAIYNLGYLSDRQGRLAEAEALMRHAVDLAPQVYGADHADRAFAMVRLGDLLRRGGRCGEAEADLRDALALRRAALPAGHRLIADAAAVLGVCLEALGQRREAEELLRESQPVLLESRGPDHERTRLVVAALARLEGTAASAG